MPKAALGGALAALLALTLAAGGAQADNLDDQKAQIEKNIDNLETDLEFLDADIQKTAARLRDFQAQLPAAQQALSDAQGRVQAAADEAAALAQRVQLAQQTRDEITEQIARDAEQLEETREVIGQIATQAYKRGGMSSNLSLLLDAGEGGDLANGIDLANQALRSQNAVLDRLSQQHATDRNSEARLAAVEEEIRGLKAEADAALVREQAARDEAEASKRKVDELIGQAQALSEELNAKRPQIQQQIQAQEAEHAQVLADIKERQERLRREAEAKRKAAEAARKAAEAEAKRKEAEAAAARKANAANARQKQREAEAARAEAERSAPKPSTSGWGLSKPVSSGYITSGFGWRPTPAGTIDYGGRGGYVHAGVDWGFGGSCGAPIKAAAAGEVWFAFRSASSGNKVTLSHGVVNGHALATNYHHMSRFVVSSGQQVRKGQVIGYVGSTGNSTGCHLHFETILDGDAVNPLGLL